MISININKKILITCIVIIVLIISLLIFNIVNYYSVDIQTNKSSQFMESSNLISVYIEDEDGNYVLSDTSSFNQGTDYAYNEEKSYCVNESVLSYNTDTSKISVTAKGADKCYVYFDVNIIIPTITSVYTSLSDYGYIYIFEIEFDQDYNDIIEEYIVTYDYYEDGYSSTVMTQTFYSIEDVYNFTGISDSGYWCGNTTEISVQVITKYGIQSNIYTKVRNSSEICQVIAPGIGDGDVAVKP